MSKIYPYDFYNSMQFELGEDRPYICSMCGQLTTLKDSVSNQGYNLVCNSCLYKMQRILGRYDVQVDIQAVGNEIMKTLDDNLSELSK